MAQYHDHYGNSTMDPPKRPKYAYLRISSATANKRKGVNIDMIRKTVGQSNQTLLQNCYNIILEEDNTMYAKTIPEMYIV